MKQIILISLMVTLVAIQANAAPSGVILMRDGQHLSHCNVPKDMPDEYYFGRELEGPAWENKHGFYRHYIVPDDRNTIDIAGKKKYDAVLPLVDDPGFVLHADNDWGGDILMCGNTIGLGCFRLYSDGTWINPPFPDEVDSIVVTIPDSSQATPMMKIIYYGWTVNSNKLDITWTISTKWDGWTTNCEMQINGAFDGMVVVGIKNQIQEVIRDTANALLATIGEQGGIVETLTDTLLMAVKTESGYFSGYADDELNYGMLLKPDTAGKVTWSFGYSWAGEPNPIFRDTNWRAKMFDTTSIQHSGVMPDNPAVNGQAVTIFPNPFSNKFTICLNGLSVRHVDIFGIDGKKVASLSRNFLSTSGLVWNAPQGLPNGVYIVKAYKNGNDRVMTRKLLLNR